MNARWRQPTRFSLLALGLILVAACASRPGPADLVVRGGAIVTLDPERPRVAALAARDGLVVALGDEDEVAPLIGPKTEVFDLGGGFATPGLIEGHGHFLGLGQAMMELDLTGAATWDEIVATVAEAAREARPGEWILGRGWHQEKWTAPPSPSVEGLPVHDALSRATPDNPVLLSHASGHSVIVNARAMALAGIDETTPDPPGGEIVRDAGGRPIGVLRESAEELVAAVRTGAPDEATIRRQVELAGRECLANGITSFDDAGSTLAEVAILRRLAEAGELPVRLWVMLGEDNRRLAGALPGFKVYRVGDAFLTVGGIKRYADGALGSHGAWLLAPYDDLPSSSGFAATAPDELRESARLALEHGLQLCTHAIGDRANRLVLDVYQEALARLPDGRERRWRVEHAQHLARSDVPRFAELGVIAAMQPTHCTSDGPWVEERIGAERARDGAYVWRDLLDSGAVLAAGTDVPVERIDPIATFYAAVTRRMADGRTFYPEQRMTRAEALRAMTLDAAYATFEDDLKGSLEIGRLADLTVLSQDLLEVADESIPATRVLATIVGGRVVYRAGDGGGP